MCKHSSLFIRSVSDGNENFIPSLTAHFQDMPMNRGVSGIKLFFSSLLLFHNKLGLFLATTTFSIMALSIMTLNITALSIKSLSIETFMIIITLFNMLHIIMLNVFHAECHN